MGPSSFLKLLERTWRGAFVTLPGSSWRSVRSMWRRCRQTAPDRRRRPKHLRTPQQSAKAAGELSEELPTRKAKEGHGRHRARRPRVASAAAAFGRRGVHVSAKHCGTGSKKAEGRAQIPSKTGAFRAHLVHHRPRPLKRLTGARAQANT